MNTPPFSRTATQSPVPVRRRSCLSFLLALSLLFVVPGTLAGAQQASSTTGDGTAVQSQTVSASKLMAPLGIALVRVSDGEWGRAAAELERFEAQWLLVRQFAGDHISVIDNALTKSRLALSVAQPDARATRAALAELSGAVNEFVTPEAAAASREDMRPLLAIVEATLAALKNGDTAAAAATFKGFTDAWTAAEKSVRAIDTVAYGDFEIRMSLARAALQADPPQPDKAEAQVQTLRDEIGIYLEGKGLGTGSQSGTGNEVPHIADLIVMLGQTATLVREGKADPALELLQGLIRVWPAVENEVKAGSADAYGKVENAMTDALSALMSTPPDLDRTARLVAAMQSELEPLNDRASYTAWHAGLTLFREGLEALLVLVALLALLKKTGQGSKQGWVWSGVASGLGLSGILAFVFVGLISNISAGSARESLEGYVGLGSVILMLSVGAWLHGKSNIQGWNAFIKKSVNGVLQKGSLWGLFFVACLAVLREGAETVIFFLGIAPSIDAGQLALGIVVALAVLGGLGFAIIRFSVKLPFHIMFLSASILIYFLAFKILGQSIHALQISGALPIHGQVGLPSIEFFGMFPTWETTLPQIVIFVMVLAEVIVTEVRRRKPKSDQPPGPGAGAEAKPAT